MIGKKLLILKEKLFNSCKLILKKEFNYLSLPKKAMVITINPFDYYQKTHNIEVLNFNKNKCSNKLSKI